MDPLLIITVLRNVIDVGIMLFKKKGNTLNIFKNMY